MSNKVAMGVDSAAEAAGVGTTMVRREIASGRLPARRAGKRVIIAIEDLRSWIANLPKAVAA